VTCWAEWPRLLRPARDRHHHLRALPPGQRRRVAVRLRRGDGGELARVGADPDGLHVAELLSPDGLK
jgi:hypothetical protein